MFESRYNDLKFSPKHSSFHANLGVKKPTETKRSTFQSLWTKDKALNICYTSVTLNITEPCTLEVNVG